jgi:hypothetical protein
VLALTTGRELGQCYVRSAPSADVLADIVERALEAYEIREVGREPASAFYARLSANYGTDVDLDAVIRRARRVHPGPDL